MTPPKGILGQTLKKARIKQGLSQEELAEIIGISPTHLKHLESEHRNPSLEVLFKLVEILHISLDQLVFLPNSPDSPQIQQIKQSLDQCSEAELAIIEDLICSLWKNRPKKTVLSPAESLYQVAEEKNPYYSK